MNENSIIKASIFAIDRLRMGTKVMELPPGCASLAVRSTAPTA